MTGNLGPGKLPIGGGGGVLILVGGAGGPFFLDSSLGFSLFLIT